MAITHIGSSAADGTTITIPVGHQIGDLLIIFAFRSATTAPSLPAGWTSIGSASAGATSARVGWKLAISGADSSGTWTNATGLVVQVLRGTSTNKTPISAATTTTGTGTSINYQNGASLLPMKAYGTSWVVGFAATKTLDSSLQTAPTNLTNVATAVGAAVEYAGHNSSGIYVAATADAGSWPTTAVSVGGTSAEWRSSIIEVFAEQGLNSNYQFAEVGDGMSTTERIR